MKPEDAEIQMHTVILNGPPHHTTIDGYVNKGWKVIGVRMAKEYHPYACDTDTILFVAKPIDKTAYDEWMKESSADIPQSKRPTSEV